MNIDIGSKKMIGTLWQCMSLVMSEATFLMRRTSLISSSLYPMFKNEKKITDWDIQALIDEELPRDQVKKLLPRIMADPILKERYRELASQKRLLQTYFNVRTAQE